MAEDVEGDLDLPAGAESADFLRQPEMSVEIVKMTDSLREQLIEWEAELTDLTEYMQSVHEEDEMDFDYIKKYSYFRNLILYYGVFFQVPC